MYPLEFHGFDFKCLHFRIENKNKFLIINALS